jgi:hypothetical protein
LEAVIGVAMSYQPPFLTYLVLGAKMDSAANTFDNVPVLFSVNDRDEEKNYAYH